MSYSPFRRLLERRAGGMLWLRVQTAMVLMLSFLVGIIASHLLLKAGLTHLAVRLPLNVVVSYAAFLLLVRVWMWLIDVDRLQVKPDPNYREEGEKTPSSASDFVSKAGDVAGGIVDLGDLGSCVDAEGCLPALGLLIFLAVLGFVLTVLWWFFGGFFGAASAALLEAGVEALLAVGMARAAGGNAAHWMAGALRASWKYWLALMLVAAAFGGLVKYRVPEATTLYQAFFGA